MLGTTDNIIFLIDSFEGKTKHKLRSWLNNEVGSQGQILEAGFSPDSKYLISGSEGKHKIVVWNLEKEEEVRLIDFNPTTVAAVKFSHVYCMIVSGC